MGRSRWLVVLLTLVVSAACSSAEDPSSADTSDAASPSVNVLATSDCLDSPCGGTLFIGSHRSEVFGLTVGFEITSTGWSWDYSGTSRSGNFRLIADESHELPYDSDGIYFFAEPAIASSDCEEAEEPDVGRSVDGLVGWLESAPGLMVSEPLAVTVGGLDGVQLDLQLDPAWKETCAFSEPLPTVPLIIRRAEIGGYAVGMLPDVSMRWYVLDRGDGGVMIVDIDDGPSGMSHDELLRSAGAVVDSFSFSRPG
jgi:hypothetical protein